MPSLAWGMAAYSPSAMTAVCVILEEECMTYRKMVGMLRNNHTKAAEMHGNSTVVAGRTVDTSILAIHYGVKPGVRSQYGWFSRNQIAPHLQWFTVLLSSMIISSK